MNKNDEKNGKNKMRKKKRKLNYFRLFLFCIVVILICFGIYWMGTIIYDYFFISSNKSSDAVKTSQTIQQPIQNKQATNTSNINKDPTKTSIYNELYGDAKYLIHIHKSIYQLDLFEKGKDYPIRSYGIAVAKNEGDKQKTGDNRTPISWGNVVDIPKSYTGAKVGVPSRKVPFRVEEIVDASTWSHDFGDGKGVIENAYGPWFISLDTGWDGIGIHGTHDPNSIGTKASEGCIRLLNSDVKELKEIIFSQNRGIGTRVIITED